MKYTLEELQTCLRQIDEVIERMKQETRRGINHPAHAWEDARQMQQVLINEIAKH